MGHEKDSTLLLQATPELLGRVPATIPGLVQPGSNCITKASSRAIVVQIYAENEIGGASPAVDPEMGDEIAPWYGVLDWLDVDLTDRTSRVHAAWWCEDNRAGRPLKQRELLVIQRAMAGLSMTPGEIDTLARLVLRLAGGDDA